MQLQSPCTISEAIKTIESKLKAHTLQATHEAEWLLENLLNCTKSELRFQQSKVLTPSQCKILSSWVERRFQGEPLQYITGFMPFRYLKIACKSHVLIPRPETELLVDCVLEKVDAIYQKTKQAVHVIEIGVGSGCISCSLASERNYIEVVGTDISADALELAQTNARACGVETKTHFMLADVFGAKEHYKSLNFDSLGSESFLLCDIIVSNPPYIPSEVLPELPSEVRDFEPELALDGGVDGLNIFRKIVDQAPEFLKPYGFIAIELHETCLDDAREYLKAQNAWSNIEIIRDYNQKPRHICAQYTPVTMQTIVHLSSSEAFSSELASDELSLEIKQVAEVLHNQGCVVLPTDSVYGIGALATENNPGYRRIFDIKNRPKTQTLPWLIGDLSDLDVFAKELLPWVYQLADAFWPGALTLVCKATERVSQEYVGSNNTIALRIPDCVFVRAVIKQCSCPLACTSANTHKKPAATDSNDLESSVIRQADAVVLAGKCPVSCQSTIVDCTGTEPIILREGAISSQEIMQVAGVEIGSNTI